MANDTRERSHPAHRFAVELAHRLHTCLGAGLVGVYLHGSVATSEEMPGRSDVDLIAVCAQPLSEEQRDSLCALLAASAPPPDVPAVDFGVLTSWAAAHPERPVRWTVMARGKRAGDRLAVTDLGGYPGDLLDVAMAQQRGLALVGPAPAEIFAPIPAVWVLGSCAEELRKWASRRHYEDPASGILNACRAWRYAEEGVLSSKAGGGAWARPRTIDPSLIDAAFASRRGEAGVAMPDGEVNAFVRGALRRVEAAARMVAGDSPTSP